MYDDFNCRFIFGCINSKVLSNPMQSFFTLELPKSYLGTQLCVYDYSGKLISKEVIQSDKKVINASDWKPGLYLINISDAYQQSIRVIKE